MGIMRYFFKFTCFAIAFAMTLMWFSTYLQNEDNVRVDLKKFNFGEGQYPMISICLREPFIESELKRYNENLTAEMYKDFLSGKSFSNETKDIKFR